MPISTEVLLRRFGGSSLQQMARHRGIDVKGKGKEVLIQLLVPMLHDPERIHGDLGDLAPLERLLLDRVLLAGGDAPVEPLRRQLEQESRIDAYQKDGRTGGYHREKGSPWKRGSRKFQDVVARLGVLGLAFTTGASYGSTVVELGEPGQRLVIPEDVLKHLPKATLAAEGVAAPPDLRPTDPGLLLRDAYLLPAFATQNPIPLTVRGQIMKRALVQIDAWLLVSEGAAGARSEEDLDRIPFLRAVLEELSLLVPRAGSLEAGEGVERFLDLPAGERLRMLYDAYLKTSRWCELFRIAGISITVKGGRQAPPPVIAARRRVLAEVAELPAGEWIPVAHLADRLKQRDYEFLIPRDWSQADYYYTYGIGSNPYDGENAFGWTFDDIDNEAEGWDRVEAGFLRVMVEQPLHWLGVVDLGSSKGNLAAFRVTTEGARLLHGETPASTPAEPRVVVQPNFQIFAFPPTGEGVLFRLDRFAQRVRAEQVAEYRLTRESVYRAQRDGLDAAAIVAFLERVSGAPLPQNVRRTLEEWGAQHDRILVRRGACLLHAVDEMALDALYADPALSPLLGRRVAPTAALVPVTNLAALHERLLESGRLPALSEGADDTPRPLFAVDGSGRIAFRHRLPSVHILRALRPFAEEGSDGVLRLAPAGLRKAVGLGLDAEKIVGLLDRWHAGPLPPEVPAMVRRWGKNWGRGALVETVLLQVENPEILADLLADPEVGRHLQPVPGAARLALVRPEAAGQVRSALEDRGMALGDGLMS